MGMVSGWRERYGSEVREDLAKYGKLNKEQPVTVREMTKKEKTRNLWNKTRIVS